MTLLIHKDTKSSAQIAPPNSNINDIGSNQDCQTVVISKKDLGDPNRWSQFSTLQVTKADM